MVFVSLSLVNQNENIGGYYQQKQDPPSLPHLKGRAILVGQRNVLPKKERITFRVTH